MKKFLIILLCCGLCSCSYVRLIQKSGNPISSDNSRKVAEECLTCLVNSILSNDKKAIQDMFSLVAQSQISNLEEEIDNLLSYCEGDFISFYGDWISTVESDLIDGLEKEIIHGEIDFETTSGLYRLAIILYSIDETSPNNEGLWALSITKTDITSNKWAYPHKLSETTPGIFYYKDYTPDDTENTNMGSDSMSLN